MILVGIAILLIALIIAVWIGSRRQHSTLSADIDHLIRAGTAKGDVAPPGLETIDTVPAVVARYLRLALGTRRQIQEVRIRQTGTLRTDVHTERWMPFEAEHIAVPPATGFVWNARVKVAPLLHVRVRDALIDGEGSGQVRLLSAFTVSAAAGTPEMNSGSLHRYLAEAVWYPTALLPSPKLRWTEIDPTRALATLTDQGISVSLEFRFGGSGEATGIYTPARWGTFPEGYRQVPWEGHFRNYQERHGVFVPTEGEVGWYIDNTYRPVWKGTITAFQGRIRALMDRRFSKSPRQYENQQAADSSGRLHPGHVADDGHLHDDPYENDRSRSQRANPGLRQVLRSERQEGTEGGISVRGERLLLQPLGRELGQDRSFGLLMQPAAKGIQRPEPSIAGDRLYPALAKMDDELLEV